jgi:hypothetical protein
MVKVSMTRLVHDMISSLYTVHRSETTHCNLFWSLDSEDLPNFVYNIVRTQDCFFHHLTGSCLLLDLSHSYADNVFTVFAKVHWQIPRITFSALPNQLSDGEMYRIIPHFADPTLSSSSCSSFSSYKDDLTYWVSKSPLPLQWDVSRECFYATVHREPMVCCLSANISQHIELSC